MEKIFVCCFGEPKGHYCWGGIYSELERRGRLLDSIDTYLYQTTPALRAIDDAAVRISKLIYNGAHYDFKGAILRRLRGVNSWWRGRSSGASAILHITTLDMPAVFGSRIKNYILIDCTWNIWKKELDGGGYSANLMRDIEALDRKSYHQAAHIFTLGRHVCDDLVSHYGVSQDKCTAIGSGLGGIAPYFGEKNYRNRTVLFVAKTRFESKGGGLLVEASKILSTIDPSIKFLIVGSEESLKHSSNSGNVEFRAFVPFAELQELFNDASLFVLPALNEPWGLVYLEAMSCKIPVLGLRRNSLPELTGDGRWGILVDDPDPQQLADAIFNALANPDALGRMGAEAQKRTMEYYTWGNAVDRMLSVIDRPLDNCLTP